MIHPCTTTTDVCCLTAGPAHPVLQGCHPAPRSHQPHLQNQQPSSVYRAASGPAAVVADDASAAEPGRPGLHGTGAACDAAAVAAIASATACVDGPEGGQGCGCSDPVAASTAAEADSAAEQHAPCADKLVVLHLDQLP